MFKIFLLLGCICMSACRHHVYQQPAIELPDTWGPLPVANIPNKELSSTPKTCTPIWEHFNDPLLTSLIQEALVANTDLLTASARVLEAQALFGFSKANQLPSLGGSANVGRSKLSDHTFPVIPGNKPYNNFNLGIVLNYEIDLWGKLAHTKEAACAQLIAAVGNQESIYVSLTSMVATSYFNLLMLEQQIKIAESTISDLHSTYVFQQNQYEAGAITLLTLKQAKVALATAQIQMPKLVQARKEQQTALSILTGRPPKSIVEIKIPNTTVLTSVPVPPVVPLDLPSTLLLARPDIQAAEQRLIAAHAQIGVARSYYFPTLSLSAILGLGSAKTDTLFSHGSNAYTVAAASALPLIDFGRTRSQVLVAEARREQALLAYKSTVQTAFKEVADALLAQQTSADVVKAYQIQAHALQETLNLSKQRYEGGYSDYLEVLDAQRTLFQSQLDWVSAYRDWLVSAVVLYKSLGGNFQTTSAP